MADDLGTNWWELDDEEEEDEGEGKKISNTKQGTGILFHIILILCFKC